MGDMFTPHIGSPARIESMVGTRTGERGRSGRARDAIAQSLLLLACLSAPTLPAQSDASGGLGIDQFGTAQGLPGLYVPDLAITGDGLLWLISSGRLTSFDGLTFEDHGVPGSTSAGSVVGIGAGRGDTLWVSLGNRLVSWVRGKASERARHDQILRDVWQEENGELWGWDDLGVVQLGPAGWVRKVRLQVGWNWNEVPPDTVGAAALRGGWIADVDGGSQRRVHSSWVIQPLPFPGAWPVRDRPGRVLISQRIGSRVQVRTQDGRRVGVFPAALGRQTAFLDAEGLLWTRRRDVLEAFTGSGTAVATLRLNSGDGNIAIAEDAEGDRWVGTTMGGLYRIRRRPVQVLAGAEGITDAQVARISAGDEGSVLVVHSDGWLTRVRGDRVDTLFRPSRSNGAAKAALVDARGTRWISVLRNNVSWLAGTMRSGRTLTIPVPPFPTRIVQDPRDDALLWLVGAGVHRLRPYDQPTPALEGPLLDVVGVARDLLVDRRGAVWVAGQLGVAVLEPGGGIRTFLAADGFPTADARALHESADGALWIGCYFGGLTRYRDGRFATVHASNGLWDEVVSSLLEDGRGNLWMGSNRGVHRVARAAVDAFLDGRSAGVHGIGFGASAGFRNPEASGWYGHRSPDGRLWFPTFSGVAIIDPEAVTSGRLPPFGVRILGVRAGTATLPVADSVTMPQGERQVEVTFGSILLSGQEGIRYRVHLEGVDREWTDVGGLRQLTYGNLPPGAHLLQVRAESDAGAVSANVAAVTLVVPSFFQESWAFKLLLALIAGASLATVYRLRIQQLRGRELTLQRLVGERTRDLAGAQAAAEGALATVEAQATELRTLGEAKSRFFANVSHELRTPLTLMLGPLRDVVDGRSGETSDSVDEQLRLVLANGQRLGDLVEQILDIARLDSGKLQVRLQDVDLRPALERLAASFDALGRRCEIALDVSFPDGAILARVDPDHVEKIFGNLLANAFEFTPPGGRVRFSVTRVGESDSATILTEVEDSGAGIRAEELERIFLRFHQVDDAVRRTQGGMGLGLALVKELAELHGGGVTVSSAPGGGSRFTVRLPVPSPDDSGAFALNAFAPRTPTLAERSTYLAPAASHSNGDSSSDADRPTVLVVEDNDDLRAYLRRHLEDRYRIVEARDGSEGLDQARRGVPDLILCDIMMPRMNGDEMCRAVRADPELSFLPIIILTAKAARSSRISSLESGADDYIVKPFDRDELRLRVENALASRRRLSERLLAEGKPFPQLSRDPLASKSSAFADQVDRALRDHLADEDFGIDALANALAMSRSTLYRKVVDTLGASPMDLLWRYRLTLAGRLLHETDASVSEVAYACGFKTVPHFTRKFKEHFGAPPSAYRVP